MQKPILTAAAAVLVAACGGSDGRAQTAAPSQTATATVGAAPVPTAAPNAPNLKPAFPGQTRAPEMKSNVAYAVGDYVTGVQKPWAIMFLPDGALLINEKPGRMRVFRDGKLSDPVVGLPAVDTRGQGGLLGLALDPNYARNGLVYWSYAETAEGGKTNTAVARGRLVTTGAAPRLENVQVIWRQKPSWESTMHYGSRLVFARDGTLYVTTGERSVMSGRMQAQNLDAGLGKIIRINADGSIPRDNPFVGRKDAQPEIFASGVRNVQAAALHPRTGELWEVEHGPRGGDEVNIIRKGRDYGWPTIVYGIEYSGGTIGGGIAQKQGLEQPVYYWDPVIAPSGMAFYQGNLFPAWKDNLFVGGLSSKALVRLVLDGDKVVGEERLLTDVGERIRDVVVGPDGALYLATDNNTGRVLRVAPK
ncbi:PQQ-dependent sugar dehydrogenase [Phenylobacterium sp.]|uniref:PQQ-dependent sugar dehydrogenase n=1 Tax=Phenylobacterium sp. TaxID=1871053 RepID=UPI002BAF00A2|nr:PQQ-dependent sugar dehydrogenase [Phenylobacterium sp.]HVI32659.1 PQQ-dependent sugar dehydrogenase [Phenylobacterium sp.]